jgi:hypothetical protein
MKKHRVACFLITVSILTFGISGPAFPQEGYRYKSGQKYPESGWSHLKKGIGPNKMMNDPSGNHRESPKWGGGQISMHEDSLVSYSESEGNTFKKTYVYDCHGNLMTLKVLVLLEGEWTNYELVTYTYDGDGNVLTMHDQGWEGGAWVDFLVFTYTYDHSGNRITWLYYDATQDFTELITSTYDNHGNRLTELGRYWDGTEYVNLELYTYTYKQNGDRLSELGQYWDGTDWVNSLKETWTYYAKNKWKTDHVEFWDGSGWTDYSLYTNTYDHAGNRKSYIGSFWFEGYSWIPVYKGKYTYDRKGNTLSAVQQYNIGSEIPTWFNTDSTANYYNYDKMQITGSGFVWIEGEWVTGDTRICIPFEDDGTDLVFANEYPSYEVDVYYSPAKFKVEAGDDATIYIGYPPLSTQLHASGAQTYSWSPASGLSDPTIPDPIASPAHTTVYKVTGTNPGGCTDTDKLTVRVEDVRCGKKMDKVLVCVVNPNHPNHHHTVCVSPDAVPSLLANGGTLGSCEDSGSPSLYSAEAPDIYSVEVSPNPTSESFTIQIFTPESGQFEIRLYDPQGRMVQSIFSGELDAGEHQFEVRTFGSTLKGMFFLNVLSPGESRTLKVIRQ